MKSATQIFQKLIEAGAVVHEMGLSRINHGDEFESALGAIFAKLMADGDVYQEEIWMASNIIENYCSRPMLMRFCFEAEGDGWTVPYDFESEEFVKKNHPGLRIIGIMDIEVMASHGKSVGWKKEWCPFVGEAEKLWYVGFNHK